MSDRPNIVLIGMPGAGKSTVGVVLAKIANLGFLDADLAIQQRYGTTLQALIDELGAEGFIELEGRVLGSLDVQGCVIATGGSAVYSSAALDQLRERGVVVYLETSYASLIERLGDLDARGVVMRDGIGGGGLRALYDERCPLYRKAADVAVNVDGLSITDAANETLYQVKCFIH